MIVTFMHIPKTGGNTFASVLYNQYKYKTEVYSHYLKKSPPKDIDFTRIKLIVGHFQFGIHRYIAQTCRYVTMIREPIDRTISDYYFNLKFKHLTPEDSPFETFVKREANRQTRWIAGDDKVDLELAKQHITQHFVCVGITEMFNESLYLMKQKLGWQNITYKQYNVNPKRPSMRTITKGQIELIKDYNQSDIQLYHWVKKNLQNEIVNLDDTSKNDLQKMKNGLCQGYSSEYANPYDFV